MLFFLAFLLGFGTAQQADNYKRYLSGPAIPLPYEESRYSPWLPHYQTRSDHVAPHLSEQLLSPDMSQFQTAALPTRGMEQARAMGAAVYALMRHAAVAQANAAPVQLAQAELAPTRPDATKEQLQQENLDLRRRIEELERMMRQFISQPPVPAPPAGVSPTGLKSVPGWLLEVHEWNNSGVLGPDPLYTRLTRDCPFTGSLMNRNYDTNHIYRFLGVFRVKTAGRYVFVTDLTCGSGHSCDFTYKVDGQLIMNHEDGRKKGPIQNGIPLSVGDHQIEVVTRQTSNSYLNYDPDNEYRWRFLVKGPDDFNAREFREDELFAVVPESVNSPVMSCNY